MEPGVRTLGSGDGHDPPLWSAHPTVNIVTILESGVSYPLSASAGPAHTAIQSVQNVAQSGRNEVFVLLISFPSLDY